MKIKVNTSGVSKKIESIKNRSDVAHFVPTTVYNYYKDFVPREEGDLETEVDIKPYQIEHIQEYAQKMYHNDFNFRKVPNSNACSHWAERGYEVNKKSVCKRIEEFISKL